MKSYGTTLGVLSVLFLFALSTSAQDTDTYHLDQNYPISENGTVKLQSDDADVTVTGSDRSDVHLVVHYELKVRGFSFGEKDRFKMEVRQQNGDLIIGEKPREFQSRSVDFGYVEEEYRIEIETPRNVSIEIEGDDDTYRISDIDGTIRMDTDDSNIELTRCRGNDFNFDFDDGELTIDEVRGNLEINNDDGEITIYKGDIERLNIDSDDGEILLATTLHDSGAYEVSMDDGTLEFTVLGGGGEFKIDHDNVRTRTGSNYQQVRSDEHYTEYRLSGGNALIRIKTDDGKIRLDTQ